MLTVTMKWLNLTSPNKKHQDCTHCTRHLTEPMGTRGGEVGLNKHTFIKKRKKKKKKKDCQTSKLN